MRLMLSRFVQRTVQEDNVDPTDMTSLKKPTTEHDPALKFKSADVTKLVDFVPGDSSKQFSISVNLDPK